MSKTLCTNYLYVARLDVHVKREPGSELYFFPEESGLSATCMKFKFKCVQINLQNRRMHILYTSTFWYRWKSVAKQIPTGPISHLKP